ncbi:alkaline phosphatase family protein [Cyclobacteriaceae bacterium YHN15]|nr:alkaline phosphatase family protein [Cyclobacteriaceae bacterium YHN15]
MKKTARINASLKFLLTTAIVVSTISNVEAQAVLENSPRLILQITIDQLRGDMPASILDQCRPGGFRYLYENGIIYENAHHRHSSTETVVGHATLATGADPADHGLTSNIWFDRKLGRKVYNIEDDRYELLSHHQGKMGNLQKDPTIQVAKSEGRSPATILTTTFSDELALSTNGKSKIFAVSVKDRGAVPMAGKAGKAFWFSTKTGGFVSSSYYYQALPSWVIKWNQKELSKTYANTHWELLNDQSTYRFGEYDDMPWEINFPGFGVVFPHPYGSADSPLFNTLLTLSPAGDELTNLFTQELILQEELGQDDVTDYLSISFSTTDYIGHIFGASSLEIEDNLLRVDKILSELFEFVDKHIGLDKTLIVFSSDHGTPEVPARLNQFGVEAQYFYPDSVEKQKVIESVKAKFGLGSELISEFSHPYFYLNEQIIREKGLDIHEVSRSIAAELPKIKGIAYAITSIDLLEGKLPDTKLNRQILRNFHPERSGDIYLVLEPHWFVNDFDGLTVASSHGSPWNYDTFVPIIFAGNGLEPKSIFRPVETVDIALTLSQYIRIKAPSGATGSPLIEVLER